MKLNEYPASVTGSTEPVKFYKCLKWEERQIVSDEELALFHRVVDAAPEMIADDYRTHESFCAEYSDEEVELPLYPLPGWIAGLERTDTPLSKLSGTITFGDVTDAE